MVNEELLVKGITISLTADQDQHIRILAKRMNRSYSYVIREIINQWTEIKGIKRIKG